MKNGGEGGMTRREMGTQAVRFLGAVGISGYGTTPRDTRKCARGERAIHAAFTYIDRHGQRWAITCETLNSRRLLERMCPSSAIDGARENAQDGGPC